MPVYLQTLIPGRIGLIGQYAGLDDALNGHDNLLLIGLYHFKMSRPGLTCRSLSRLRGPVVLVDHAAEDLPTLHRASSGMTADSS